MARVVKGLSCTGRGQLLGKLHGAQGWVQGWSSFPLRCLLWVFCKADTLYRLKPALASCLDLWLWSMQG